MYGFCSSLFIYYHEQSVTHLIWKIDIVDGNKYLKVGVISYSHRT